MFEQLKVNDTKELPDDGAWKVAALIYHCPGLTIPLGVVTLPVTPRPPNGYEILKEQRLLAVELNTKSK